jgi:PAS domain S-box-containing protein
MAPPIFWFPQLLACVCSVGVALYVWRRRNTHGARTLLVLMLATAEWSLLSALHKAVPELSTKLFLARIQYVGIVTTLPALLVFVAQYTGQDRWVTGRNLLLLSLFPALILLMAWTNPHHGLIWKSVTLDTVGPGSIAVYRYGLFFWLWVCFSYGITLTCALLLIRTWIVSESIYRKQVLIMLVGFAVPWAANGLYLLHFSPLPQIDMTPIAFSVTGIFLGIGLFWGQILDIVPVAHRTVLENMQDGIVVLDHLNRVAHLNRAARNILDFPQSNVIGQTAAQAFTNVPLLAERILEIREARMEITLALKESHRHYDLDVSVIRDKRGQVAGRLINFHDVTKRKKAEEALRKSEKMYRDLTESIPLGIFQTNRKGRVTFANRCALNLLEYEIEDLDDDLKFLSFIAPEDRERPS